MRIAISSDQATKYLCWLEIKLLYQMQESLGRAFAIPTKYHVGPAIIGNLWSHAVLVGCLTQIRHKMHHFLSY